MARGKRNRTERVQSLAQLLPKDGFDYECNPEIFTDHNYPGYVVKAVMVEWAAHKLIHPWMVDQLMERLFEKATKLAHNTESYGGLDNFWSVVCSQIDWIRTHHLMERIIVQELADGLMQARVRARTYGPYIRVEDGLSKTAVAIDNYHRRLADSNLHSLIPVLNEDDAKDFDDNGDYKSVPSEDEPPMEELLALDAQALEHLGLYDYVYGGQDYDMVPEFGSGNIMYETIEYIEIDGTGKRKPVSDGNDGDIEMTTPDVDRDEPGLKRRQLGEGYCNSKPAEEHKHIHRSEGRIYKSADSLITEMKNLGINPKWI